MCRTTSGDPDTPQKASHSPDIDNSAPQQPQIRTHTRGSVAKRNLQDNEADNAGGR